MKKDDTQYLKGKENWFIRMFFYLKSGNGVLNEFRYLILGIMGMYAVLKLTNPLWLIGMFLICVPILIVLGNYWTHRMAKVSEWLSLKFSTHYAIKQYNMQEATLRELRTIRKYLAKKWKEEKGKLST